MVDAKRDWEKLTGIGMVVREVESMTNSDKRTKETAYYVSSVNNITDFAKAARSHWGVESMHWSMDVVFGDDRNQTRAGVAAQNLAIVKCMLFNTLKNETCIQPKKSKNKKRIVAATDPAYRDVLINLSFKSVDQSNRTKKRCAIEAKKTVRFRYGMARFTTTKY